MTCATDSTTITASETIKIKRAIEPTQGNCLNCKYLDCGNKPEYLDFLIHWPAEMEINFEKRMYHFLHNPRPYHPEIKYGEKGFEVNYDLDGGYIKFDKKNKNLGIKFHEIQCHQKIFCFLFKTRQYSYLNKYQMTPNQIVKTFESILQYHSYIQQA